MNVLVIDIGGSHVKMLATGVKTRREFESGPTMTVEQMVSGVLNATQGWKYEAVSIGYPGVVLHGRPVAEPHNLAPGWVGFDFEAAFGRPIKLMNDAAMQALGSYKGGRMLFLGLGTGLGSAMVVDGVVEAMELGHLPYKKGTYEDYVGEQGLKRRGKAKWRRHVNDVVALLVAALEPTDVVLGGGNLNKLEELPPGCRAGDNANAFLGGFRLWEEGGKRKAGLPQARRRRMKNEQAFDTPRTRESAMATRITKGKFDGLTALADERGVISAVAMDQRGSLTKAIAQARGGDQETTADDLTQFKIVVAEVLTKYATGILLDPEYGLPAIQHKSPDVGVLLAYEQTGYDEKVEGRLPGLLPQWNVRLLTAAGADAIKVLLYYNPFDKDQINETKHTFVERVGAECVADDVAFFLELVTYDDALGDVQGIEYARRKPEHVTRAMEEFSKPQYSVDILKVEVPVNLTFVEGTRAFDGTAAHTRSDAMRLFREAASVAAKPFIYLSAGVTDTVFLETLELAVEAGTNFSGVLCGRAGWQGGIPAFARGGPAAFTAWLEDRGVRDILARNTILAAGARPWWTVYGGKENIEVAGTTGAGGA